MVTSTSTSTSILAPSLLLYLPHFNGTVKLSRPNSRTDRAITVWVTPNACDPYCKMYH
jgi:hypothetical protein